MTPRTPWLPPGRILLSNGPIRTIAQPKPPNHEIQRDAQITEFLLPFPIFMLDTAPFQPITVSVCEYVVSIEKPYVFLSSIPVDGTLGNESPDASCTVIRVIANKNKDKNYPTKDELWVMVRSLLKLIRVKTRQYWMLQGSTGFGTVLRGSIITQSGKTVSMENFAKYGESVLVAPLESNVWRSCEGDLQSGFEPPVEESLYCDALANVVTHDWLKAVLEIGVAAEIAITALLTDAANLPPTAPAKRKFIAEGERDSFYAKLQDWPARLGLQSSNTFRVDHLMEEWQDALKEAYRIRGGAAHSGKLKGDTGVNRMRSYVFACAALLEYCRQQRQRLGIPVYSFPPGRIPFDQVSAITDAALEATGPAATVTLP